MNTLVLASLIILGFITVILSAIALKLFTARGKDPISKDVMNAISDLGALKALISSVENNQKMHNQIMQDMKGIIDSDTKAQSRLQGHIEQTLKNVESIRQSHEDFQKREQENRESLKRMETVIAGSKLKGMAGENILKETLCAFPAKMVQSNARIKGKPVEFALILPNNKIMPIDSKWTASGLLDEFSKTQNDLQREKIAAQIEKEVLKRVSEVSQYIDADMTTPWAIAAIPDSAYNLCKMAHFDAYKQNVILISYSMLAPYLLMFFSLYLQYCSSIDMDNLMHYLIDIKRHMGTMSEILENQINKGAKMITNASDEYRQIIGSIKGSLAAIENQSSQSSPEQNQAKKIVPIHE
jgi:DNA recombination protein RmuC